MNDLRAKKNADVAALATALEKGLAAFRKNNLNNYLSTSELARYFQVGGPMPESVYHAGCYPFARKYMLPNYLKAQYLLAELEEIGFLKECRTVLDIGSGPGTFAIALMAHLRKHKPHLGKTMELTMLDCAKKPLELFDFIQPYLSDKFYSPMLRVRKHNCFIGGRFLSPCDSPQLIVLSNSIIEILRNPKVDSDKFIADLIESDAVLAIIDFAYPNACEHLNSFSRRLECTHRAINESRHVSGFRNSQLGTVQQYCRLNLPDLDLPDSNVEFVSSIWAPLRRRETRERISEAWRIIDDYKQAWENHDVTLLKSMFAKDAVYCERPDRRPFRGLREIVKYWTDNSKKQTNVQFDVTQVDFKGGVAVANWNCRLYRKDIKKWLLLNGVFHAKLSGGKITHFSESFDRKIDQDNSSSNVAGARSKRSSFVSQIEIPRGRYNGK